MMSSPQWRQSETRPHLAQTPPLGEIRVLFETMNPVPNAAPTYNGAPTRHDSRPPTASISSGGSDPVLGQGQVDRRALHLAGGFRAESNG